MLKKLLNHSKVFAAEMQAFLRYDVGMEEGVAVNRRAAKQSGVWLGRAKRLAIDMLLFAALLLILSVIYRDVVDARRKLAVLNSVNQEVVQLREENLQWHAQVENASSEEVLERSIRDKLHLVKPGEKVFVINEDVLQDERLEQRYEELINPAAAAPPPHGWDVWLSWVRGE